MVFFNFEKTKIILGFVRDQHGREKVFVKRATWACFTVIGALSFSLSSEIVLSHHKSTNGQLYRKIFQTGRHWWVEVAFFFFDPHLSVRCPFCEYE